MKIFYFTELFHEFSDGQSTVNIFEAEEIFQKVEMEVKPYMKNFLKFFIFRILPRTWKYF